MQEGAALLAAPFPAWTRLGCRPDKPALTYAMTGFDQM